MVQGVFLEKAVSKKDRSKEYVSLVFDCGYREVKVFADTSALMAISGLTAEEYYGIKVGDKIKIVGK